MLTGYLSVGRVTGPIRDVGQNVLQDYFETGTVATQLLPHSVVYRVPVGGLN